ncbi:MAG: acyl-CoA/acyl-ACP dehydrogenase [Microthrixaceae bacterium]|nr:acyl-CoA/acyl-ACP dehydrogenase [Microthrixaceae bacterium]
MDFSLEEEQSAIAELAAQVIGDHSTHDRLREIERSDGPRFDTELWAALADTGVLGACIPEEFGGAGLDLVALGAVLEEAGRHAAAVPLWETLGLAAPAIAKFAPKALASEILGGVAAGQMILTAGWHERGGDVHEPGTVAERTDDGWTLTGTKVCVPAATIADGFVIPASIADGSVGLFFVRRNAEGLAIEPLVTTLGDPQGAVLLADTPAELIAEGRDSLRWSYERAVATQCATAIGVCAEALRLTAEYSKERKQFEVPIASFQAVAHRLADSYVDTEGVRLSSRQALWRLSVGMDASTEVATAKYWASHGGQRVVHAAQHIHGGVGVDRDYPLHRYFLAAKELELQLGGETLQLRDLGRMIAASTV